MKVAASSSTTSLKRRGIRATFCLLIHFHAHQCLFTDANKHHQIAQSKIEFSNYQNYLFARVHYQIVIPAKCSFH